ncbi:unnamed protein product [Symbiodinium natans]|uniref:Methyltransferase FkbM domain-containing protein n=1 Tax=Symbiodinium natans TaxID=878477 RepID=A0A812MMG3_9DINO|nr:unnamed protein product [Symbiodinium natans]
MHLDYRMGSGAGPSLPIFYNMYRDRCLEFDDIYAWEAHQINGTVWWGPMPDEIREKTRFFNLPVVENGCKDTTRGLYAPRGSFLHLLPIAAKVEDYVVVKVDIDGGPELQIMEAIARQPELSSLVDEIFFEYHVYFDGINFGWGKGTGYKSKGRTIDAALDLMKRLRQAGIRSHFWV